MNEEEQNRYFLNLARKKALDSNCKRRQVGALIVKDGSVLISTANGSPPGSIPCMQGGCIRCQSDILSGEGYDSCICIHAEQLAIAKGASTGLSISGATLYVSLRPCLPCLNLCLHSGLANVIYDEEIVFKDNVEKAYGQFLRDTEIPLTRYP